MEDKALYPTIDKIRSENIQLLIEEVGGLNQLMEKTGLPLEQIESLKKDRPIKPRESRIARSLERKLNKPEGWMDVSHEDGDDAGLVVMLQQEIKTLQVLREHDEAEQVKLLEFVLTRANRGHWQQLEEQNPKLFNYVKEQINSQS